MSKFSGKCDFYDHIQIFGLDKILASKIYVGDHTIIPLRIDTEQDCIPYYPYLIGMSCTENGVGVIHLSNESFIDTEEKEYLNWILRDVLAYYKKCKRNHMLFDEKEALNKTYYFGIGEHHKEIIKRVAQFGVKATIDGIHTSSHDYYRYEMFEEMTNNGYSPSLAYYWLWHKYISLDELNIKMSSLT
jgi:hypothetical protein